MARMSGAARLRIVDARSPARFAKGHIPGAIPLPLSAVTRLEGSAQALLPQSEFEEAVGSRGIASGDPLVFVGERGAQEAAYLFWAFDYYGHQPLFILDGGMEAWQKAGGPVTADSPAEPPAARYTARPNPRLRASRADVAAAIGDEGVQFLDTRTPDEFTGRIRLTRRGGHIPGARRFDWESVLDEELKLRPPSELRRLLVQAGVDPGKRQILYCLTGPRAAHTYWVLRSLGFDAALYDRSWSEWGNDESLPVQVETSEG